MIYVIMYLILSFTMGLLVVENLKRAHYISYRDLLLGLLAIVVSPLSMIFGLIGLASQPLDNIEVTWIRRNK